MRGRGTRQKTSRALTWERLGLRPASKHRSARDREEEEEEGGEKEDGGELGRWPAPPSGAFEALLDPVQREPDGLPSAMRGSTGALLDPRQREPDGVAAAGEKRDSHVDEGEVMGDGGVLTSEEECSEYIQRGVKMGSNSAGIVIEEHLMKKTGPKRVLVFRPMDDKAKIAG